jgi:hypothetical protein
MPALLVQPFRFTFLCLEPVYFPPAKMTNILRGAFGLLFRRMACVPECHSASQCQQSQSCPYARLFESSLGERGGPAGMADPPRPFVLRSYCCGEMRLAPGQRFEMDAHLFDFAHPYLRYMVWSLMQLADEGIGPGRARARLISVQRIEANGTAASVVFDGGTFSPDAERLALRLTLDPPARRIRRVRLSFLTPTEFKFDGGFLREPRFEVLVARARDRINALARFYQNGPLPLDFRGLGERARRVRMYRSQLDNLHSERWSARTGARHEIGGFLGHAEYEGDLNEFLPLLEAAYWTGLGRQTVWGNGAVRAQALG